MLNTPQYTATFVEADKSRPARTAGTEAKNAVKARIFAGNDIVPDN